MTLTILRLAEFNALLADNAAVLIHFTSPDCSVCGALRPRLQALLESEFPRVAFAEVDCQAAPEVAAQQQVFAVPTLLLFLQGRESQRWVRNLHLAELREALVRPYPMLFGDEHG